MDKNLKLTANFTFGEFWDHGTEPPGKYFENIRKLANELQKVREAVDRPITINSGWRTKEHNLGVGGASNSQHLVGCAADVTIKGLSPKFAIVYLAKYGTGFNGIGIATNYTHVDMRGNSLVIWTY